MVAGTPADVPTNSYLRQFLSRAGAAAAEVHAQHPNTNTNNAGNDTSNREREDPREGQRDGNPIDPRDQGETDDHDAVARYGLLPTPRSPPRRPSPQQQRSSTDKAILDHVCVLKNTSVRDDSAPATISFAKEGGDRGRSSSGRASGTGGGRLKQSPKQPDGFMIDGDGGGASRLRASIDATTTCSGIATSSNTGEQQQQQQQQQRQSEDLASSSTYRRRHATGLSKSSSVAEQQYGKHLAGDRHGGDGRTLNARESSARFWEESDSLDAKSSSANNDRGFGLIGGSGRRDFGGETAAFGTSDRGTTRGGQLGGRQGETAAWAGGSTLRGVWRAGGVGVAAGRGATGGSSARKKKVVGVLSSADLPLGQALRTMGGLIGGDGAKLSAVGKHITSLEGVPPGVSSRATQLFLSNNSLASLRGLEAFSGAACLSLSHNLVRRTVDLRPLAALTYLETLSLEGNPVCGTANYRAHVISLASPCLKTLDHREVTPAEASDAPAIVAAEISATRKTARERCRCLLLRHMYGLSECHAELREVLLGAGAGSSSSSGGRLSWSLPRRGGLGLNGRRGVWRQRLAVSMPVHQMLTVLQAESWLAFNQSELDVLERLILDEAAEVFAGVVATRRSAGQRTHGLAEGAVATLGSPCTRMWAQVLGEVQRRTEGNESGIVLRCEGVRRRETERFRHVSAQTNAVLQDLAAAVGCSDNQWAVPPYAAAKTASRHPNGNGGSGPRGIMAPARASVAGPPRLQSSPPSFLPQTPSADAPRANTRSSHEHGPTMLPARATRSCPSGISSGISLTETAVTQSPDAVEQEPDSLGHTGADRRDKATGGGAARDRSETHLGKERLRATGSSQGGRPTPPGERRRQEDERERREPCSVGRKPLDPAAAAKNQISATSAPSLQGASETGRVGSGPKAGAVVPKAGVGERAQTTTMASAAQVLLARVEVGEGLCCPLENSNEVAGVASGVPCNALADMRNTSSCPPIIRADGEDRQEEGRTLLSEWSANRESTGTPNCTSETQSGPEIAEETARFELTRSRKNPRPQDMSLDPSSALPGGRPAARLASSTACSSPPVRAPSATPCIDTANPAADQQQSGIPRQRGSGSGAVERRDEADGSFSAPAERLGSSSEATKRLLREALRVKRLLAAMDGDDTAASTPAAGNGLGDEDADGFLAGLGLVELKPLSTKLVEALDRGPWPFLGDPSAAVSEPRTTRGLRDQVAALGKEVVQRAEACAGVRKLHATLRRQVEVARRARSRNLDTMDVACRTLIAKAGEEVQALHESRRVAQEAERYHETLASLQEGVEVTIAETRRIISESETLAWQLRTEMEGRGGDISARRRAAEEGLEEWEQGAENDPDLRARRRAYDCEILVLRHRMGYDGANGTSLASALCLLRARTQQQRRAREWFAEASARRDAALMRSAFGALARNSRSRAAMATATTARCRAGLAAWRQAAGRARKQRASCLWRERAMAMRGLRRWRARCAGAGGGGGGDSATRAEELEWRLELFREHRAKRVVFRAWRGAAAAAAVEGKARRGTRREGRRRRGLRAWQDELTECPEWGARLRTAEALVCRRRFETRVGLAFRWWLRLARCNALARTAGQRRALRWWRRGTKEARAAREATAQATGSYVISLGRRVLIAWSIAASTRAHRRTGAASLVAALTPILKRAFFKRWTLQAAAVARESDNTVVALEHCYHRCLSGHLRSWQDVTKKRRVLRRCAELLQHGQGVASMARGLRLWRRQVAKVREATLRKHRIKAWAAAADRRRRLASLTAAFSAWTTSRRRVATIHRLTRRAAARRQRLALVGGFRALRLAGRRAIVATPDAAERFYRPGSGDDNSVGMVWGDREHPEGEHLVGAEVSAAVQEATVAKAAMEEKVGQLRARLAQEKSRALERRAAARQVADEVARSERERARYAQLLRRQMEHQSHSHAPTLREKNTGEAEGRAWAVHEPLLPPSSGLTTGKSVEEYGQSAASVAEGSSPRPGLPAGFAELTEREGEVFGKLQAETLELHQRTAEAEKQEELLKVEVSRTAVHTAAALQRALAEGNRLKAEAEKREFLITQLELDAQQTAAHAAALSQRLVKAEQDLGFEATRNARLVKERGEGNARLRAAAIAAEKRIAAAENALHTKGRAIEELRSKCARENVHDFGRGKRARGRGGGRGRAAAAPTSGLEFQLFAARADAQAAVERSTVAAVERRSAAGSLLAEALRAAGSEAGGTMAKDAEFGSCSSHGDDDDAGMAKAWRLAAASVANERREVAELALRDAEAKMRRSADLSSRTGFGHQLLVNPIALLTEDDGRSGINTVSPSSTTRDQTPASAGDRVHYRAGSRSVGPSFYHGASGRATKTCQKDRVDKLVTSTPGEADNELTGTRNITLVNLSRPSSSSALDSGAHDSVGGICGNRIEEAGTNLDSGRRRGRCLTPVDKDRQWQQLRKRQQRQQQQQQQQQPIHQDGLRELKREISDLEGKILGRLGGVDRGGDGCIEVADDCSVHGDRDGDKATAGEHPVGGCKKGGYFAGAKVVKRSARATDTSSEERQAPPRGHQRREGHRPSLVPSSSLAPDAKSVVSRRRTRSGSATSNDHKECGLERASRPSCPPRVHGSWEKISAISSAAASASSWSRESQRNGKKQT